MLNMCNVLSLLAADCGRPSFVLKRFTIQPKEAEKCVCCSSMLAEVVFSYHGR